MGMRSAHGNTLRSADETFRPRNLLQPCLLILLEEAAGYGYELHQRLDTLLGSPSDTAAIYRGLNALEDDGLVASQWERSAAGPERRRYAITPAGQQVMAEWAKGLVKVSALLLGILRRYECGLAAGSEPPGGRRADEETFWQRRILGTLVAAQTGS
jgi:PadR family transcriptional regulator